MGCCSRGAPAVPVFPLLMNIWHGVGGITPQVGPPTIPNVPCQHVLGELDFAGVVIGGALLNSWIKTAKNVDVHWARGMGGADVIECPAGSGLWYVVNYVANMARGFSNEHRVIVVTPGPTYPIPIP